MPLVIAASFNRVLILWHLWLCLIFVSLTLLHFRNVINKIFLKERKDLKWKMSANWTHASLLDARRRGRNKPHSDKHY